MATAMATATVRAGTRTDPYERRPHGDQVTWSAWGRRSYAGAQEEDEPEPPAEVSQAVARCPARPSDW